MIMMGALLSKRQASYRTSRRFLLLYLSTVLLGKAIRRRESVGDCNRFPNWFLEPGGRVRWTVEHTREGYGHAVSSALGSCASASPVTGPEDRRLALSVRENNHRVNEYAPGKCDRHRVFRLLVTGSLRPRFLPQFVLGRLVGCPVSGAFP